MKIRWIGFWLCALVALLAFGGWRTAVRAYESETRGHERATRQMDMPYRLPLPGVNVELTQYDDPQSELTQIADVGFVWLRQPFLWEEIEPEQGQFNWETYDIIVDAVAEFDGRLKLVALLDGTPAWARHHDAPEHPFAPPESPAQFGDFARAVAARYGDRIDFYQIWDEPNIEEHWGNLNPRAAQYVAMLDAAYRAIHDEDSRAMVIAAALAPTTESGPDNINDPDYLHQMYEFGGGDSFDAAAAKPYGFDDPPTDRTVDVNELNFSRWIWLREEMLRQGDGDKPLWGSNFGWNSLPENWAGPPSIWGQVSAEQQNDYTNQAFERAAREFPWSGGLIVQHWQPDSATDDPIQGFAIRDRAENLVLGDDSLMHAGLYPAVNPYATYDGDWTFSDLGADAGPEADQNTIIIAFEGTEFALLLRRGDYLAYLSVTIDGSPAGDLPRNNEGEAFIALTAPRREAAIDLILAADGLDDGPHVAVITHRPELGDDHFPIVGFAVGTAPDASQTPQTLARIVLGAALIAMVVLGARLPWGNIRWPSSAALRNLIDFALGLFFSAVVMFGALLTWHDTLVMALRRDLPAILAALATSTILFFAPSTWIALAGLLLTGLVIFSRPWLGVLQVIFWSAFFTSVIDPFFRAINIVEAMLIITLAATGARLLYDYANQREKPSIVIFHPLDLCMMALAVLGSVSLLWSDLLPEALRELRVMLIEPALFYALIRVLRPDRRDLAFAVEVLLFTGFLLAAIGIVSFFTEENVVVTQEGARRLISVYGSPNSVGLMLGRILPFALAYLLADVTQWRKILAAVCGITMLVAVALSQSVGAILLGLPAAVVVMALGWRGRNVIPALAGVGAAGVVALIPLSRVLPRLRQITDIENNTTVLRLNLWRSTVQMLEDKPLTGVGMDQFLYAYRSRYILPEAWQDPDLSHPHNILLDYWVRLGILGVMLAVALQWFFWRQALAVYRAVREVDGLRFALVLGAMGAMADFLAHGLVDMAHFNINLSYIFALLLALVVQVTGYNMNTGENKS
jgi:O-antigen ligase